MPFSGVATNQPHAPDGFLLCNGDSVSRTQYPELFSIIGDHFGPGDGANMFKLPDLRGRSPLGAGVGGVDSAGNALTERLLAQSGGKEAVQLTVHQIPRHRHGFVMGYPKTQDPGKNNYACRPELTQHVDPYKSAIGTEEAGGDQPHDNMAPFLVVNFIIKF
jgi:microcystin-dependent protein